VHQLWAEGLRVDGSTLPSNVIEVQFVSADAGWRAGLRLVMPILLLAVLAVVAMIAVTAFSSRRFQPGVYGGAGGAVCPRCALPMARHVLSPNIGLGMKLERCPHCGKWSLVGRATNEQLAAAEARLRGGAELQLSPERREEDLRRKVDDSRFLD
jgi:hypothetical protein